MGAEVVESVRSWPEQKHFDHQYRDAARALHASDGEVEIDGESTISAGEDDGVYVKAWVWVPNSAVDGVERSDDTEDEADA